MPNFNIVKTVNPKLSFRVNSILGRFDLKNSHVVEKFTGEIELNNFDWQIGIIVGASGSGKTTISKEIFGSEYNTKYSYTNESILDDMPNDSSIDEIIKAFNSVGFSSPPSWLKPYSVLSNGQKMRVDLANALLSHNKRIVFDEFSSVIDRNVAKVSSYAIQKAIKKTNRQFVAISCHYDIIDWLMPDWVFNTNSMQFHRITEKKSQKLNLQSIEQNPKMCGDCLLNITI